MLKFLYWQDIRRKKCLQRFYTPKSWKILYNFIVMWRIVITNAQRYFAKSRHFKVSWKPFSERPLYYLNEKWQQIDILYTTIFLCDLEILVNRKWYFTVQLSFNLWPLCNLNGKWNQVEIWYTIVFLWDLELHNFGTKSDSLKGYITVLYPV